MWAIPVDAKMVRMPVPCKLTARLSKPQFTRVIAPLMTAKAFPCSVSSLWRFALHHHPSPLSLRQVSNGDRHLEVGAGSALETRASPPRSTIRAHSPRSGYRQARPCPGIPCEDSNLDEGHDPSGQKVSRYIRTWYRPSGASRSSRRNVHRWAPDASAQCPASRSGLTIVVLRL